MPRNHKENNKNENNGLNRNRNHSVSPEEPTIGKKPQWTELEITGTIRNLSPNLFHLQNLTALYVKNNNLQRLPPDINQLVNLRALDLSCNKLRSLPAELGDLMNLSFNNFKQDSRFCPYYPACYPNVINGIIGYTYISPNSLLFRELLLSHNFLRILPYELGKLFNLIVLGLHGNPLNKDIMTIYSEPNGTHKLLTYMLDNLQGRICLSLFLALPGAYNVQPL
ncbi:CCR4-NOT transcription complex subunit 6-like isoform X1 [Agrilus planipennis]|uniref:CCR4-NOT transcription complex subunit 6-like isoform X1 n=1 Tax=Agrilus planipennis TaxID=224129 RepID=A0A1W4XQK7_AGRPL|nr:CCR4-NOT transcription complex subunit 6-like isoform X1 [Agrilus planipennis]